MVSRKPESGDELGEPLRKAAAHRGAELKRVEPEHQMGEEGAETTAGDLNEDIGNRVTRAELAPDCHHERHHRIEMRARDRREDSDDHDEDGAGRKCVAQERQRIVPARQLRRHDG